MNYRYIKGSAYSQETVEFDLREANGEHITTCSVNVDTFLCGVLKHPCGDGDDVRLTPEQQRDILTLIKEEREKLRNVVGPKSIEGWEDSGLPTFEDYFLVGDTVTEDVIDYFIDILPPATFRANLLQVGEPSSHEKDPASGKHRAIYPTFARTDGRWWYAGDCFIGETTNRRTRPDRLSERISEVESIIKKNTKENSQ